MIIFQHMGFLKFFGRILIVTAIVSSAFFHLESSERSVQQFQSNYATLDALSQQYLQYDLPLDHTNWVIAVKIFGVFEVLVILLIIVGDGLGGFLYTLSILGEIFFLIWAKFAAGSIASWNNVQLQELSRFVVFLGISFVLSCSGCAKKATKND